MFLIQVMVDSLSCWTALAIVNDTELTPDKLPIRFEQVPS